MRPPLLVFTVMKITNSFILLDRLRFHAYHGVLDQERTVGNEYEVSLRVYVDVTDAAENDTVDRTVNYAQVYGLVDEIMRVPRRLVEAVAGEIARRVLHEWPDVSAVDVRVVKLNPPMGAACKGAGVEIHALRD